MARPVVAGPMELGVVFPQTEIGTRPESLVRFAQRAEELGYRHLLAYEHVLGVNADRDGGWDGPYDHTDTFHEPFTLFSYLAAFTDELEFVTGVLVLPQRQTALVAKQAAQVDRFSGGRLRLGVGVGWNHDEYVGMGEDFGQRGRRIEEQVDVLRQLWTENPTTYDGEYHQLPDVGINPLPVQRPIPIWMGGHADIVLRRIARTADGWMPLRKLEDGTREKLETLREYVEQEGRKRDDVGVHGYFHLDTTDAGELVDRIETWSSLDTDYLSVLTMGQGRDPEEHTTTIERFAEVMADAGIDLAG